MLIAACAALVGAAPSAAAGRTVERGIVQAVEPEEIVLRALDGTEVTVPVEAATRIRLNGRPAPLPAIQRGFVAEAVIAGDGSTLAIRAFGRVDQEAIVGRLVRIGRRILVVRSGAGERLRVVIVRSTRVWRGARHMALARLRPGMRVQVVRAPNGSARVVLVLGGTAA